MVEKAGKASAIAFFVAVPIVSCILLLGSTRQEDNRQWRPNDPQYSVADRKEEQKEEPKEKTKKEDEQGSSLLPGMGRIEGSARGPEGKPLEKCAVFLVPFNGVWNPEPSLVIENGKLAPPDGVTAAVPGDDGGFSKELPAGMYKIHAWAEGFAPLAKGVDVHAGKNAAGLELAFEKGARFEGRIDGAGDHAIKELSLVVLCPGSPFRFTERPAKDGTFRFENLPGGPYTLLLLSEGSLASALDGVISGSEQLVLRAQTPFQASLQAFGEDEEPLRSARFSLAIPGVPENVLQAAAVSSNDGILETPPLPPGRYLLRPETEDEADLFFSFAVTPEGKTVPERIVFPKGREVKGKVLDSETGEPVEGALVCNLPPALSDSMLETLVKSVPDAAIRRWMRTDARGALLKVSIR